MQDTLRIASRGSTRYVSVNVQPRSSRCEVVGRQGTALKVRLKAAPVEGAANDALVALLAARLGVPRRARRVIGGATSRAKTVESAGPIETAA